MIKQTHLRYRLPWRENLNMFDVLHLYSDYRGEWDPFKGSMKFFGWRKPEDIFRFHFPMLIARQRMLFSPGQSCITSPGCLTIDTMGSLLGNLVNYTAEQLAFLEMPFNQQDFAFLDQPEAARQRLQLSA